MHVRYKYANPGPGAVVEETGQRFWLGADQLGRGTLSRLLYGALVSLYVSIVLLLPASARMVFATAKLGDAVVVEAALSFLGVGTPPDVPSWGGMLSITDQKYIEDFLGSSSSRVSLSA